MTQLTLSLLDHEQVLASRTADSATYLAYRDNYPTTGAFRLTVASAPAFVVVQLDAALKPALLYLTQTSWTYHLPFQAHGEWPYPPAAFAGDRHYAAARYATEDEIRQPRNLAENSHDQHDTNGAFPHASANAETRGESVFFAKNAIDGMVANESHGIYPFQSWGIDMRDDATMTIDFGRPVLIRQLGLVLRADYPHDSYWTALTVGFDGDEAERFTLQKTADRQLLTLSQPVETAHVVLRDLVKATDSSTFPALTQCQVFGTVLA